MDPYRGFHHRLLNKRQDLGGVLDPEDVVPSNPTSTGPAATAAAAQTGTTPGLIDSLTSLLSNIPPLGPSTTTSSTPLTRSPSSSTGSTSTSTSSAQTTTPPSTKATPTSTPSTSEIVYTSSDGTSVVYLTSTLAPPSATPARHTSFFQNPPLEGGVFALVGIVTLILVFIAVTWTLRKRRRTRLERDLADAVTFDPGVTQHYERQEEMIEKRRLSGTSSGHGHGYGYGVQPAYAPRPYHGPMGYGQYPAGTYGAPSASATLYRVPSPTVPEPAQSGANLKRKFSDRKPVPPLFLDPASEPSNAHAATPPQFYQV